MCRGGRERGLLCSRELRLRGNPIPACSYPTGRVVLELLRERRKEEIYTQGNFSYRQRKNSSASVVRVVQLCTVLGRAITAGPREEGPELPNVTAVALL